MSSIFFPLQPFAWGENASDFEAPSVVYIKIKKLDNRFVKCSGTLIADRWVLTAAHCLNTNYDGGPETAPWLPLQPDRIFVVARKDLKCSRKAWAKSVTIHEKANFDLNGANDIGIIELESPLDMPIQHLILRNEEPTAESKVTVAGWGFSKEEAQGAISGDCDMPGEPKAPPIVLRKAELQILSSKKCKEAWGSQAGQICTKVKANAGPCYGDSGGPLYLGSLDKPYQIALVSKGSINCTTSPAAYTFIPHYKVWIERIIGHKLS